MDAVLMFGILLVVCVIIFAIFREVIRWYWKLNEIVVLLTDIKVLLGGQKAE